MVGGYRKDIPDPISKPINQDNFYEHQDYLFAIDLINHGYFWESHVYFEAIWHANHRKGPEASYCKAMVKIAAGAIKTKQGRLDSARRLFKGANEIFSKLPDNFYLGISIQELETISKNWITEGQKEIKLNNKL